MHCFSSWSGGPNMLPRPAALLSRNSANCSLSTTLALARAFQNSLRSTSSLSKSALRALNNEKGEKKIHQFILFPTSPFPPNNVKSFSEPKIFESLNSKLFLTSDYSFHNSLWSTSSLSKSALRALNNEKGEKNIHQFALFPTSLSLPML